MLEDIAINARRNEDWNDGYGLAPYICEAYVNQFRNTEDCTAYWTASGISSRVNLPNASPNPTRNAFSLTASGGAQAFIRGNALIAAGLLGITVWVQEDPAFPGQTCSIDMIDAGTGLSILTSPLNVVASSTWTRHSLYVSAAATSALALCVGSGGVAGPAVTAGTKARFALPVIGWASDQLHYNPSVYIDAAFAAATQQQDSLTFPTIPNEIISGPPWQITLIPDWTNTGGANHRDCDWISRQANDTLVWTGGPGPFGEGLYLRAGGIGTYPCYLLGVNMLERVPMTCQLWPAMGKMRVSWAGNVLPPVSATMTPWTWPAGSCRIGNRNDGVGNHGCDGRISGLHACAPF